MTDEQATVDFVELDIDAYAAQVAVTDAALREYYEENKARFTQAGRRHARHILVASTGDDKADEAKAKKAYERAAAGEDFAKLARELSDDTGSKESGGDLGDAERADFVGPFGDAVWSMKPGEIRGPVKTEFGWHVIKLESVSPETVRSFEEVRAELEPEYRRSQVDKAFGDAQERLDTLAFESGSDLGAVASKMGLPLKRVEAYTRAGSAEISATPKLTQAVFSPEVLAGREIRTVELAPGKVVAIAVKEYRPAKPKPLPEVRTEVVESARLESAGKLAAARAGEVVTALQGGAAWAASAAPWRGDSATMSPKAIGRQDEGVPAEVRDAAFRAQAPAGQAHYGLATMKSGDTAIWTVTAMEKGKLADIAQGARGTAHDEARDRKAMSDATVYVTAMRAAADVDVNPQVFE